jgi:hypothetical protein
MKKPFLIIGRTWKFLEFMTPTVESVYEHHDRSDFDMVVIENKSSRSRAIRAYLHQMLRGNVIDGIVLADGNYFADAFKSVYHFQDQLLNYENIIFTDMDLDVRGHTNWLYDLKGILDNEPAVGAVSIDVEPDPPYSDGFVFTKDVPEHTSIPGFYPMTIDLGFYMVRAQQFHDNIMLPGSHGYNNYISATGLMMGRVSIMAKHYGWLRSTPEYAPAYSETGITFGNGIATDNMQYYGKQCVSHDVGEHNFQFEGPFFTPET